MNTKIKIVISGSFRKHLNEIGIALANFRKLNIKVLAPLTKEVVNSNDNFVFITTDDSKKSGDILEKEFMANIKKTDFLYVANIDGYVGQSVATEIGVAVMNGIPVVVSEEIQNFSGEIPKMIQKLLKKSVFWRLPISEIGSKKIAELNLGNFTSFNLSTNERILLQSLIEKLLESLKFVKMAL